MKICMFGSSVRKQSPRNLVFGPATAKTCCNPETRLARVQAMINVSRADRIRNDGRPRGLCTAYHDKERALESSYHAACNHTMSCLPDVLSKHSSSMLTPIRTPQSLRSLSTLNHQTTMVNASCIPYSKWRSRDPYNQTLPIQLGHCL